MAAFPASNAEARRLVCCSKYSRPFSNRSPALTWASPAASCAFFKTSPPCSVRSSRASRPVFGVSSRAAAAPAMVPRKNSPEIPRRPEHVPPTSARPPPGSPPLPPRRDPGDLPDPADAAQHTGHLHELRRDLLGATDDDTDALEFPGRLPGQAAELLGH